MLYLIIVNFNLCKDWKQVTTPENISTLHNVRKDAQKLLQTSVWQTQLHMLKSKVKTDENVLL